VLGLQGLRYVSDQDQTVALWLVVAQSLPLVWRSKLPTWVLGLTAAAAAVQMLLGLPATNATLGQAVATTTVVSRTRWSRSWVPPVAVMALNTGAALWGEPLDLTRHVIVTATSLVVAWVIGDASGRRAAVTAAIEDELQVREQSSHLRAQLKATEEQLRIAQELHRLVGEALDGIVVHAGAARLRLDLATVSRELATIEAIGRDILARLDRFLGQLRSSRDAILPDDTGWTPPVPVAYGHRLPKALVPWVSVGVLVGAGRSSVGADEHRELRRRGIRRSLRPLGAAADLHRDAPSAVAATVAPLSCRGRGGGVGCTAADRHARW
jgi:hypothetical protein